MLVDDEVFDHPLESLLSDMRIDERNILAAAEALATEYFLCHSVYLSIRSDNLVFLLHMLYYYNHCCGIKKMGMNAHKKMNIII